MSQGFEPMQPMRRPGEEASDTSAASSATRPNLNGGLSDPKRNRFFAGSCGSCAPGVNPPTLGRARGAD
jgi:hypothetical protein